MKKPTRIKIITMGNAETGKSCMVKRFCEKRFVNKYQQTIGIDYGVTRSKVDDHDVKVNIFDFGGHSCFLEVRNEFYKDAQGCLLVFDVADQNSFRALDSWMMELKREYSDYNESPQLVCIVCANKTDKRRIVSEHEGRSWAEQRGFRYFETSASSGKGIDEVFQALFDMVVTVLEGGSLPTPDTPTSKPPMYTKDQLDAIEKVRAATDNYGRLGLRKGASRDDVNRAYRKLAILLHPDKTANAPGSEEAFKIIVTARADILRTVIH